MADCGRRKLAARPEIGSPLIVLLIGLFFTLPVEGVAQGAGDQAQARAEQMFIRGMTAAYVQDHETARELFRQVLDVRPDDPAALSAMAETLEALGDITGALFHAQLAAEAAPEEPALFQHLAELYLVAGDAGAAVEALESLIEVMPSHAESLALLARVQQQADRPTDALATYERLLDVIGESASVRSRMLHLHRRAGDQEGVREALEALVDLHPENHDLRRQLADAFVALDREDEAISTLERLLEDAPSDSRAAATLADLYRDRGETPPGVTPDPDVAPASESPSARLARATARYQEALTYPSVRTEVIGVLNELDHAGGLPTTARFMLGELLVAAHGYASAIDVLEEALADEPANVEAWGWLAAAYQLNGGLDRAQEVAEDALLLFPGQPMLMRRAALIHLARGEASTAARLAGEMQEIVEEDYLDDPIVRRDALSVLGEVRLAEGDAAEAARLLGDALSLARSEDVVDAYTLLRLGDAEQARGRSAQAREHWEEAARIDPHHPEVRERAGQAR